ncbi:hypothetical protein SAMN05216503_2425 [Polaribacter sp. KT25b]|uniref:hypothetical protein n=1 Tax=Polaribacter sp. KT25b TaxID=1855336 RepID=UPI0008798860|nr:hypothetical protein [Polaribacter sp. KT25b]SDS24127.1 hypothetical protein SAMN05216503_2425 [Polaribacter sp. KT25b]
MKTPEAQHKEVILKSYPEFQQIEKAVNILKKLKNNNLQVTIIGKLDEENLDDKLNEINLEKSMEKKCLALFEPPLDFGILSNPNIGTIFIAGFLVSMFLQEVEHKKIGVMLTGPFGILRGLGINKERTSFYLEALHRGNYLFIVRGYDTEINQIKRKLSSFSHK